MRRRLLVSIGLVATSLVACGGGGGSGTPKCIPGQSVECAGPGACMGNQVCMPNGTFGACTCGGTGTAGVTGSGGRGGTTGSAGSIGTTGTGGTTGTAGASGTAGVGGTTGGAGAGGNAGSTGGGGRGGTTGAAGIGGTTGGGGRGGTTGAAGAGGTAGAGGAAGTGGSGSVCDPVVQTGCTTGQRCAWVWTTSTVGHNACLADGTVNVGGTCTVGAPGETTGFDNCKKGTSCIANVCKTICTKTPDTCATNYGCNHYAGAAFDPDGTLDIGFCDPTCDPLAQTRSTDGAAACGSPNASAPTLGCFGSPDRNFVCANIISTTKTHGMPSGTPYANACAPGYQPLTVDMTGSTTVICVALCKPADTSTASPGNVAGQPGSGYTCPDKGAGSPPNECRYWWWLENMSSRYGNTLGFCLNPANFRYDSNNDGTPDTVYPSCATLSPTAHNYDATLTDAQAWGCMAHP